MTSALPLDELASRLPAHARRLTLEELSAFIGAPSLSVDAIAEAIVALPITGAKLHEVEGAVVHHALQTCGGNQSAAARLLGINRKKFERMLARHATR